jgi:hypothetical protein
LPNSKKIQRRPFIPNFEGTEVVVVAEEDDQSYADKDGGTEFLVDLILSIFSIKSG